MAKKSTKKKTRSNAAKAKPYPEFPLTPMPDGRWRKILKGKVYYFGDKDDTWQNALDDYKFRWPYILAGKPVPDRTTGHAPGVITLADLLNEYVASKKAKMDNGELSPRTYADHIRTGEMIVGAIDRNRDIETIGPNDFAILRQALAEGRSLETLGILVYRVRSVFNYAVRKGLRKSAVIYGDEFDKPHKKAIKKERSKRPAKLYSADECRALLEAAPMPLRSMILLALNAGLGNTDIGALAMSHIDLDAGIVATPREKTGEPRRAVLWPETVQAVREAIEARPTPQRDAEGLVYVTKYGRPWVRSSITEKTVKGKAVSRLSLTDAVGGEFGKLIKALKMQVKGRSFYALRHTFRTVADEVNDRPAIDLVMGHDDDKDMSTHYRHGISDDRLKAVSDHAHQWLFGSTGRSG